ncbi:hypothetical protein [Haliangium sp.]|uniref:hypothetical protein n=1 Tax=Haliangium sp. TaxID=2663208 RepID=UPI003D0FD1E3
MKTLLFVIVVLGAAGALAYKFLPLTAEARACSRLADLCSDSDDNKDTSSCEEDFASLERNLGPEAVERATECVSNSDTCVSAVTCIGTGVLQDAAGDVIEGIKRGIKGQ